MAYDPQRERRRPKPNGVDQAPVEAILDAERVASISRADAAVAESETTGGLVFEEKEVNAPVRDDPPPDPSVTPQPADPWPDRLLFGMSISTIVGVVVGLAVFRWMWVRRRTTSSTGE